MIDPLELELVRMAGCVFLGTASDEELLDRLDRSPGWSLFHRLAVREGMEGVAAVELRRIALEHDLDLPLERFAQSLQSIFVHNGAHLAALARIRAEMGGRRAVVLKGAALLETAYGRQLGLRPLSDIDLLVERSEIDAWKELLRKQGFVTSSPGSGFFVDGKVAVDLHSDLVGTGRLRHRSQAFRLDTGAWDTARPWREGEPDLLQLSEAHQFLHLAVHALKHSYSRLIWVVDLGLLARRLNWVQTLRVAAETGSSRALAYAVRALEALFRIEAPAELRDALPGANPIERGFSKRVARRQPMTMLGEWVVLFSMPDWRAKLGYSLEYVFLTPAALASMFPSVPRWLLYPRRVVQILGLGISGAVRRVRSRLSGPLRRDDRVSEWPPRFSI